MKIITLFYLDKFQRVIVIFCSCGALYTVQRFIQALFHRRRTPLETQSLTEFLNSIFQGPNGTVPGLHLNQT